MANQIEECVAGGMAIPRFALQDEPRGILRAIEANTMPNECRVTFGSGTATHWARCHVITELGWLGWLVVSLTMERSGLRKPSIEVNPVPCECHHFGHVTRLQGRIGW